MTIEHARAFAAGRRRRLKTGDFFETPSSMTRQLLEAEPFDKDALTLEPACGRGAIVFELAENGFTNIKAYDREYDFFKEVRVFPQIITNPPFSLALQFILKAKEHCSGKFAFLLPLEYLHGKERLDLIFSDREFPLVRVHVFCRRPLLGEDLREDGRYNTGFFAYAWFVWERGGSGPTEVRWIDNSAYVLRARGAE